MRRKNRVRFIERLLGCVRVATQELKESLLGLLLSGLRSFKNIAKALHQDRPELLDVPDLLLELVGSCFALDVLREALASLNQREPDLLDELVGSIDRFFGCIFEFDKGRDHAHGDNIRTLRKRAFGLR